MGNQVDLETMPVQPMSSRQPLTNALAHRQPGPEDRKEAPDSQEIMGNLEAQDPTDNPAQLVRLDHLVQTGDPAPRDRKDHPVTTANKLLEPLDPRDPLARLDRLVPQAPAGNQAQTVNQVDPEHLAPPATKEHLVTQEDPAKMAPQEHLETQDLLDRARNALRLVWLLAISQPMIPRCTVT